MVSRKVGQLWKILLVIALLAAVVAGGGYFYLFRYDALPLQTRFSVDWNAARELAGNDGPVAVHSEKVADGEFFGWMLEAGGDWNRLPMEFRTFQLAYANGDTIMIDAPQDHKTHSEMALMLGYDDQAFAHMQQAMREATTIIVTHEHFDHITGLLSIMGEEAVVKKMFIPAAQRNSPRIREAGFDDALLAKLPPADYQGMHKLAPGVVLIATPGHTPGNQIVYVHLADGSEDAFIGDIAWNSRNYRDRRAKTVMMNLVAHENAAELNPQIAYFADLIPTSKMNFIISHDPQWTQNQIDRGLIQAGLLLKQKPQATGGG